VDSYLSAAFLNGAGVVSVVLAMGFLVFRGHLIPGKWHREALNTAADRITKAEERADRWEAVALRALDATERLTEPVVVATKVLTTIPTVEEGGESG
jgi:hypothetical protein